VAAPIELAGLLREALFDPVHSTVLTSATLTTKDGFGFLRRRLGIGSGLRVEESVHPSPFDFADVRRCWPCLRTCPTPGKTPGSSWRWVAAVTEDHARLTDGGLFVLFTSYSAMRGSRRGTGAAWHAGSLAAVRAGRGSRADLLQRFTAPNRGILLGVASFWEGVDVPGDPLRGLIITRIPFKVPTEPLTAARIEAIDRTAATAFTTTCCPTPRCA
jgi:ATP-dependent DNA helicase DinG